jgi:dienelactone hydrolase
MVRTMCPDCFRGTLRGDVVPQGVEETIHGLPTYVARPEGSAKPVGVIVIISDAFGWDFLNTRALADAYARRGPFLVYVPDFMAGTYNLPSRLTPTHAVLLSHYVRARHPCHPSSLQRQARCKADHLVDYAPVQALLGRPSRP